MSKRTWICPTCKASFRTEEQLRKHADELKAHAKSAHPPVSHSLLFAIAIFTVIAVVAAGFVIYGKPEAASLDLLTAVIFGIVGGFTHDLVQNKRIWQNYQDTSGGIYLGSAVGLLLGGVSGLLIGLVLPPGGTWVVAAYGGLTAGLSLKGLAEAAGTVQPKQRKQP